MVEGHGDKVIKKEVFDELIGASVALTKKILEKEGNANETITQEEADFANAFLLYSKEFADVLKGGYNDKVKSTKSLNIKDTNVFF